MAARRRAQPIKLLTSGLIADELGVPVQRVLHILRTRSHIQPKAMAGNLRLYDSEALAMIRYECNRIDARQSSTHERKQQKEQRIDEPRLF